MKVTLTFEDNGTDCKCTSDPSFEVLAKKVAAGYEPGPAEAYAMHAMLAVRQRSKELSASQRGVQLPKLRRMM